MGKKESVPKSYPRHYIILDDDEFKDMLKKHNVKTIPKLKEKLMSM